LRYPEHCLMAGVGFPPETGGPVFFPARESFLLPCPELSFRTWDLSLDGILLGGLTLWSRGVGGFYGLEEYYLR
jgi:hypothetical protein